MKARLKSSVSSSRAPSTRERSTKPGPTSWLPAPWDLLERRGITYAPDYVINAGGLISVGSELHGWTPEQVRIKVWEIYDTVLLVLRIAKEESIPTYVAADRLAERRLAEAKA